MHNIETELTSIVQSLID